jgi:hypothetical protein
LPGIFFGHSLQPLRSLLMEHLYVVSAGLTGFFLVMLGSKPGKARHDLLMAGWLALVLFHLLVAYRSVEHPYTPWLEASSALVFGHGPLLYAYTLALTQPAFRPRGKWLLHLLPLLLNLLLVAPALLAGHLAPWHQTCAKGWPLPNWAASWPTAC